MTATVTDLAKWREEHPPLVRLLAISGHLAHASFNLQREAWKAWWSFFLVR